MTASDLSYFKAANLSRENAANMTPAPRLKRVLFAAGLDASMKFSSTEEQIFLMACAFHEQRSLFLPVYQSELSHASAMDFNSAGLQVENLDFTRFRFTTLRRLLTILHGQKIEVVHWNFYSPLFNWYVWWLTLLMPRLEHYFTDHASRRLPLSDSTQTIIKTTLKRILFKRYRKVLGGSEYNVDRLRKDRTWIDPGRWYYCVNTDRFRPNAQVRSELRNRLGAENHFVCLFVGNLIADKGVDVVLRALNRLPQYFVLWIVGEGEERQHLQSLCEQLSLVERVVFLGLQRCVEPYMQAADCLVCPSMWQEAAGQVNMEALSCELPVIASRVGGIPEFIEEGKTGLLFAAGNAMDFAHKLERLANDSGALKAMAAAGRVAAIERFSIQARLNDCLDLYRCAF